MPRIAGFWGVTETRWFRIHGIQEKSRQLALGYGDTDTVGGRRS